MKRRIYKEFRIKPSCNSCEFNFGNVCAGHGTRTDNQEDTYGSLISEMVNMFPSGCDDWNISFEAFVVQQKLNGR